MVYKSGIKEWIIIFCICGLPYGLFMGLSFDDIKLGVISGMEFAFPFTLCMVLFSKYIEKKSEHLRKEISKVRKIICEGPANHKTKTQAIGGWLFFSEDAIEFYPHKMNIGGKSIPILIDDIEKIETISNQLKIHTKSNETFTFVVNKAKLWKQSITEIL